VRSIKNLLSEDPLSVYYFALIRRDKCEATCARRDLALSLIYCKTALRSQVYEKMSEEA